jgi:hypothetical protein
MSIMESLGWKGKKVRHKDGRTGAIDIEDTWFGGADLHIACEDGSRAVVRLNARRGDGGEAGWQWWCPEFSRGAAWLPLGDNGAPYQQGDSNG